MTRTCFALGAVSVMRAWRYAAVDGMSKSLKSLPAELQDKATRVSAMLMRAPGLGRKYLVTRPVPLLAAVVVLLIANMDGGIDPFDRTGFVWAIRIANFCLLWTVFHYCQDLVLRWFAMAILSLGIPLTFLTARAGFRHDATALSCAAVVAAMPGFLIGIARVSNEYLAVVLFNLLLWLCVEKLTRSRLIAIGAVLGLGFLAKAYFLAAIPPVALLLLWKCRRR